MLSGYYNKETRKWLCVLCGEQANTEGFQEVYSDDKLMTVLCSACGRTLLVASECSGKRIQRDRSREEDLEEFKRDLDLTLEQIREFLIRKNSAYGNSALSPLRIFYKGPASDRDIIRIRLDDKLSRLFYGDRDLVPEKEIEDMRGYTILDLVAELREKRQKG